MRSTQVRCSLCLSMHSHAAPAAEAPSYKIDVDKAPGTVTYAEAAKGGWLGGWVAGWLGGWVKKWWETIRSHVPFA